jgi:hypothetical protein
MSTRQLTQTEQRALARRRESECAKTLKSNRSASIPTPTRTKKPEAPAHAALNDDELLSPTPRGVQVFITSGPPEASEFQLQTPSSPYFVGRSVDEKFKSRVSLRKDDKVFEYCRKILVDVGCKTPKTGNQQKVYRMDVQCTNGTITTLDRIKPNTGFVSVEGSEEKAGRSGLEYMVPSERSPSARIKMLDPPLLQDFNIAEGAATNSTCRENLDRLAREVSCFSDGSEEDELVCPAPRANARTKVSPAF